MMDNRAKRALSQDEFLKNDPEFYALAEMIGAIPDEEPPHGISETIMARIIAKDRRTILQRFHDWVLHPMTFRITPIRIAPVLALVIMAMVFLPRFHQHHAIPDPAAIGEGTIPIVFTLSLEHARTVSVVGSFNGWDPAGYELHKSNGNWILETALPTGRHEYSFLIDGQRIMTDPRGMFTSDDGFGNRNTVLILGNDDSTA
jgi:hypothetical protein